MEKHNLDPKKVMVEEIYTQEGVYVPEGGQEYRFKTATLKFTIKGYPLIFTAKVDKGVKGYLEEAYENSVE